MKVTLDGRAAAEAYTRAFRHLTTLPGFEPRQVLRAEAGSILKQWAGKTKVTTMREVTERARYRAGKRTFGDVRGVDRNPYHITVNTGVRGGDAGKVWQRSPGREKFRRSGPGEIHDGGNFSPNWVHWKRGDWSLIQQGAEAYGQNLRAQLGIAPRTIGFSRQAVIQIADALGIDLAQVRGGGISAAGIAKARAAISSGGKTYQNGQGYEGGDKVKSYVQLLSTLPYGLKIGMDKTLALVVSSRAKYIETAYAKGAGESINKAVKAFPNIFKAVA